MQLEPLKNYHPSGAEIRRHRHIEVVDDNGDIKIIDHSNEPWIATPEQTAFFAYLFDDPECEFSIAAAAKKANVTMKDVKRWSRREPEFLATLERKVAERQRLAVANSDLMLAGAVDGDVSISKEQKWAINKLIRIREFVEGKKIRMLQINQQINVNYGGIHVGMNEAELEQFIDDIGTTAEAGHPGDAEETGSGIIEGQTG